MKKLFSAAVVFSLAAILIVVGVFAMQSYTFSTLESSVTFESNSAYVQIDCQLEEGRITDAHDLTYEEPEVNASLYTYDSTTDIPKDTVEKWTMSNLVFQDNPDDSNFTDRYKITMTFTNNGVKAVTIDFGSVYSLTGIEITGGYTGSGATGADDGTQAQTADANKATDIAAGSTATFIYIVKLTDFQTSIDSSTKLELAAQITC